MRPDWHPNAKGHELLARRIFEDLMELDIVRIAVAGDKTEISHANIETQTDRNNQ